MWVVILIVLYFLVGLIQYIKRERRPSRGQSYVMLGPRAWAYSKVSFLDLTRPTNVFPDPLIGVILWRSDTMRCLAGWLVELYDVMAYWPNVDMVRTPLEPVKVSSHHALSCTLANSLLGDCFSFFNYWSSKHFLLLPPSFCLRVFVLILGALDFSLFGKILSWVVKAGSQFPRIKETKIFISTCEWYSSQRITAKSNVNIFLI